MLGMTDGGVNFSASARLVYARYGETSPKLA
jgi:hypothetical protein